MKKCFSLLLVLLVLASVPVTVLADNTVYTEGTLYYTVGDETITIVGCFGKNESITVPNSIGGIPVNTIASGAFVGNKYLKTLLLPDTITTVEGGAIGGGINVVYNYNVTEPVVTPPPAEDGEEVVYVPSVEVYNTPEPTNPPVVAGSGTDDLGEVPSGGTGRAPAGSAPASGSGTQNSGTVTGSGEADADSAEDEPVIGDVISEADVDLDEIEAAQAAAEAAATEKPEETPAPTEAPAATPTEEPAPEPEAPAEEQPESSFPRAAILIGLAVVFVALVIISLTRRKKR